MRVVFMGTPNFALYSLDALCREGHDVLAVVTQPDRPANRGTVVFSPVKKYALEHNIPVLQYAKVSKEGVDELTALGADIFITAAYGQILSRAILDIPPRGVINVHASLLPKYRGSSPIQWAIIKGEKQTGITIMQTAEGLDCGDILLQKTIDIAQDDTAATLFDKLGKLGAAALIEYLGQIQSGGEITPRPQDESQASYYPMLKKSDGLIDWSESAESICNKVRGVTPWPGAYTRRGESTLKLFGVTPSGEVGQCGEVLRADKNGVVIGCGDGSVSVGELQAEGKRRMTAAEFINGSRLKVGEVLG